MSSGVSAEKLLKRLGTAEANQETAMPATEEKAPEEGEKKIETSTDSLFVKVENRMVKITLSNVFYIEGMSEYLKIHLVGTDEHGMPLKPAIALYSLKRLEERLPSFFMRIHRSFIINLRYVKEVSKNRVTMENDVILPIGEPLQREPQ